MLTELLGLLAIVAFLFFAFAKPTTKRAPAATAGPKSALLIIDVQNDFLPPKGSLAVGDGDKIIPGINQLRKDVKWDLIALTQDFHPKDHCSFSSNNAGSELFKPFKLPNGQMQMMWPAHCVQGSQGTEFSSELLIDRKTDKIVQKGLNRNVDSYSGFYDNDHKEKTKMEDTLREAGITDVFCTGLAYDYCVGSSALDAKAAGFNVYLVEDLTRGVAPNSTKEMKDRLIAAGVKIINASDIPASGRMAG